MKKMINNFLRPFHVEVHGVGYLKKLHRTSQAPDAMETQVKMQRGAKVIFDIGANRGTVTRQYSDRFPGSVIHAFEPHEPFHQVFRSNNPDKKRVFLEEIALAEKEGEADFYLNSNGDTNSLFQPIPIGANSDRTSKNVGLKKIQTTTLDNYCRKKSIDRIDILKMDAQGSELPILKGGEGVLRQRGIELIYTEAYFKPQYKDQPLFYDIALYLQQFGYYLEGIYDPYYNDKLMLWCDAIFVPVD